MPNVKKAEKDKTSGCRLYVTLTPPLKKAVDEMAREEQRPVAAMLRILVERGLDTSR